MTVYYKLVFGLLVFEIAAFALLIVPLPLAIRRKFYKFVSTNSVIGQIIYGLKISFIFVGVLFFDACQRVWKIEEKTSKDGYGNYIDADSQLRATKFYNHRNFYLTGTTLLLGVILNRFYALLGELLQKDLEIDSLKKGVVGSGKEAKKVQ